MSFKEILEELPKLTPEERHELRDWLAADEFAETDELIYCRRRRHSLGTKRLKPFNRGSQGAHP